MARRESTPSLLSPVMVRSQGQDLFRKIEIFNISPIGIGPEISESIKDIYSAAKVRNCA